MKNKTVGNSPLDNIFSNSKNSSNKRSKPFSNSHLRHRTTNNKNKELYGTYGNDEYVPHDSYLYNLIKGVVDEHNRKEESKSKGILARLFRRGK